MSLEFSALEQQMLAQIADLEGDPTGAYNVRINGESYARMSTDNVKITPKKGQAGIDVVVKPNVKCESVHSPVIMTDSGRKELVYNDFYIGKGADVTIVAGCGIDNCGGEDAQHDGVHAFHLGKGSRVKYVEKHLGSGAGSGGRILNPVTKIEQDAGSNFELSTVQLGGVTRAVRTTTAKLGAGAKLHITERILTSDRQTAKTQFDVTLAGKGSAVEVVSRAVARNHSQQEFISHVRGTTQCYGRVECDGIMLDKAVIRSTPQISAENVDATLTHEATIGKIAGEQLIKLQTLGLTVEDAENMIIQGFLA